MTDASHATPGPLPPYPQRSGHGCLWGCLLAAAIAIVAVAGVFSYLGWYLYSGFEDNPTLHMVMSVVNGDETARSVLGDNIRITSLQSTSFTDDTATGSHESYVAQLRGSKSEGVLTVSVDTQAKLKHITSMILTAPDGRTYDLTISPPRAPPGSI